MKKIIALSMACLFTLAASAQKKGKWVNLLDGEYSRMWHSWNMEEMKGWTVEDGVLSTEGKSGDLVTNEEYGDFEMEFDFKVAPKGNSGILYKIREERGNKDLFNTYASGPEYQIIDDVNYPAQINNKQRTGANYDMIAPNDLNTVKPAGEWNKGVLKIKDNKVEHWLNGKMVVEYTYGSDDWNTLVSKSKFAKWEYAKAHDKGHISLQGHGDPVSFRNIKIREL